MRKLMLLVFCLLFLVGCVPPAPSTPTTTAPSHTALSAQELQGYESAFAFSSDPFNWNAQALLTTYDDPKNLDLALFFYNGIGTQTLTDEEENFIRQSQIDPAYDIIRIDVTEATAVLEQCFGIAWEETSGVGLDRLLYNEKETCYYLASNGVNVLELLDIRSGTRNDDGSVSLTYTHAGSDTPYVVTFFEHPSPEGIRYQFVSNVPCN